MRPNPHENCREFVETVLEMLNKKRAEPPSPDPWQEFTPADLNVHAYSGFFEMLWGRVSYPLKRHVVGDIAEYLEATLQERNRLPIAAGYIPEQVLLEGKELEAALEFAHTVISYWPLPSFYITRDWNIHGWNNHVLNLYDVTDEELLAIPAEYRHVLHLIFDPRSPVNHRLSGNAETWLYTVKLNIFGFKQSNILCKNDAWYKERVAGLMMLPKFEELWKEVEVDRPIRTDPLSNRPFATYSTEVITHGRTVWVLGMHTSLGNFDYPLIVSYIPYREEDQRTFAEIGLPTPETGWQGGIR